MSHSEDLCPPEPEPESLGGEVPMLPIQKWFFGGGSGSGASPLASRNHWNQSFTLMTPELNPKRVEYTMKVLAAHHDAFRLR